MKEEGKKPNSNNSWKKLVRKKWFYPAVYLTFAALILTAVIWYQNRAIDLPEDALDTENTQDQIHDSDLDTVPVVTQEETLKMPVANATDAEIVTKFFDYDAPQEDREQALILYNNKYYQSVGVDIASANDEAFDVTAAMSGTVTEVKEDPLQGMVVELTHDNGVTTKYSSLEDVTVSSGAEVTQGDVLGTAGRNLFGQANGVHVHFELRKDGTPLNPEDFFNKTLSDIELPKEEEDEDKSEETNVEEEVIDDAASEAEHDELSRDEGDANEDDEANEEENADENADEETEDPDAGSGDEDAESPDAETPEAESSASSASA